MIRVVAQASSLFGPNRLEACSTAPSLLRRCMAGASRSGRLAGRAGFTLLEMTVVLAVIMILSLVIFSTTLRQLDRVAADKELATLNRYAEALKQSVQRNGSIPGAANWVAVVATELGTGSTTVATNDRRRARILLVDPDLEIGRNGGKLPYTNCIYGSTNMANGQVCAPINPRLILLSCLSPLPLPAALTSGSYTTADFTNLWNWAGADQTLPAGTLWTGWSGTGLDLQVQRINLAPLFVHLLLMNYPLATTAATQGRYSLVSPTNYVYVPNTGVDAYFIKNTLIGLINTNGATDAQLLTRDSSFLYGYDGVWRVTPKGSDISSDAMGAILEQMMVQFAASKGNANAAVVNGVQATPNSVANAMTAFMAAYVPWANKGFPTSGADVSYYTAAQAAYNVVTAQMEALANNLQSGDCN